tara:strand:+ start:8597 stop:9223 length:627 start_codon:yes stop_codon:yes gene_type:complete
MKVAVVLKSGGDYNRSHVEKIKTMVENYVPHENFICFTDTVEESYDIPLVDDWPGWWSKMELFKIRGPLLFLDLDTIITGNINQIIKKIKKEDFVILGDLIDYERSRKEGWLQSSLLYWSGDASYIYNSFKEDCRAIPAFLRPMHRLRSDQDYIMEVIREYGMWQDFSSAIVSFREGISSGKLYDEDKHKIIIFHGSPRPWEQDVIPY